MMDTSYPFNDCYLLWDIEAGVIDDVHFEPYEKIIERFIESIEDEQNPQDYLQVFYFNDGRVSDETDLILEAAKASIENARLLDEHNRSYSQPY